MGVGLASAALMLAVRLAFAPMTSDRAPYALNFLGVVLAALLAGWRSGLVALILGWFVSPGAAFFTSDEVGQLYERSGRQAPVTALNGLWYFPGMFLLGGTIIWFVKTNGALNDYWRSYGAV